MNERTFQSLFTKWIRENYPVSAAFELKVLNLDKKKSLAFRSFQPQQIPSLQQAKHGCVYKKLSDMDPSMKPFDAMQICQGEAWVVILVYASRKTKTMYWIDVDKFVDRMDKLLDGSTGPSRKSFTADEIKQMADREHCL